MMNDLITIGAIAMLIYGVVVCGIVTFDLVTGRWKRFVPKRTTPPAANESENADD